MDYEASGQLRGVPTVRLVADGMGRTRFDSPSPEVQQWLVFYFDRPVVTVDGSRRDNLARALRAEGFVTLEESV